MRTRGRVAQEGELSRKALKVAARTRRSAVRTALEHIVNPERQKYARPFIAKFRPRLLKGENLYVLDLAHTMGESPFGVALSVVVGKEARQLVAAKLVFPQKDVMHIMAVQGAFKAFTAAAADISAHTQKSPEHFLLDKVLAHAKESGYAKVRFITPESLSSFMHPTVDNELLRTKRGKYLFNLWGKGKLSAAEGREFDILHDRLVKRARAKIKEMYVTLARDSGFTKGKLVDVALWPSSPAITKKYWELSL